MSIFDRTEAWLRAWDSQGRHRTATAGDEAGAAWLLAEARAMGAPARFESFTLDRVDPIEAYIEIDGTRIDGVPIFDGPLSADVRGSLGLTGGDAPIGVSTLSPRVVYTEAWPRLRTEAAHRALVIVCAGDEPGLGLLNAERFKAPYGSPALQVTTEAGPVIEAAMARGAVARVVIRADRVRARALNVVVDPVGGDASASPLVVMTPRSSWWQSTSERGGGLVCWLETLREILPVQSSRPVLFTANSGHEIGHLGLDAFLESRLGWDGPLGATWVHYGANIGAAGGRLSIMSGTEALAEAMRQALIDAGRPADEVAPASLVPSGETRDIHRAGGRYVTLVGSNPLFHLPQDRFPEAVDVPAIARVAAGAAALVRSLASV